jgi:putative DNA primase/helicase
MTWRYCNAIFVSAVATNQGRWIAEALVKQATGGDRITARCLYSEFFEFPPPART